MTEQASQSSGRNDAHIIHGAGRNWYPTRKNALYSHLVHEQEPLYSMFKRERQEHLGGAVG